MLQEEAFTRLIHRDSVFLTGAPGSGKSFLLRRFTNHLKVEETPYSVTASTGIAATAIGGVTLASFAGIGISDSLSRRDLDQIAARESILRRFNNIEVLIIDEVSMLSSQTLDFVDHIAKATRGEDLPFGGIQMVLVGDMFQLPPVTKERGDVPFAFKSAAWRDLDPIICYLDEQHRQDEGPLSRLLIEMRSGELTTQAQAAITERVSLAPPPDTPALYAHNVDVDAENLSRLNAIKGKSWKSTMKTSGEANQVASLTKGLLSPEILELKVGAKVMFTVDDPGRQFVNGSLATVVSLDDENPVVKIDLDGRTLTVNKFSWVVEVDGSVVATAQQYPLRLAWAMTIHKSQGMTLDRAHIDLARTFTPGMGYVALSRLRSIDGLYLKGLNKMALRLHDEIFEFDSSIRRRSKVQQENYVFGDTFDDGAAIELPHPGPHYSAVKEVLSDLRRDIARREDTPPNLILSDHLVDALSRALPTSTNDLTKIKGIGGRRAAKYGDMIVASISAEVERPVQDFLF